MGAQPLVNIPKILARQSVPVIFRVSGDKKLPAVFIGNNRNTCDAGGSKNHQFLVLLDIFPAHLSVSGMRNQKAIVKSPHQRMVNIQYAVAEDAGQLFIQ